MTCWRQSLLVVVACLGSLSALGQLAAPPNKPEPEINPDLVYLDSVLAIVHADVITIFDVTSETRMGEAIAKEKVLRPGISREEAQKAMDTETLRMRTEMANRLVEEKLIYAAFKRKGFEIPRGAVDSRINRRVEVITKGNRDRFREQVKSMGMTMEDYRQRIQRRIAVDAMLDSLIYRQIQIAPEDIHQYYKDNIEEYSKATKLKLLFIKVDRKKHGKDKSARIAEITKAVKGGMPFVEAAKKFSDVPEKYRAHVMEFDYSQLSTNFKAALTKMKKGFTSAPVEKDGDTYWLHIVECKLGVVSPFSEVSAQIREKLMAHERDRRYKRYIRKLKTESYVKKYYD